jgi:hypothetical protein
MALVNEAVVPEMDAAERDWETLSESAEMAPDAFTVEAVSEPDTLAD